MASGWEQDCVKHVMKLNGVRTVLFDQCCFGAVTKVSKSPVRKRTVLLTNSNAVVRRFTKQLCKKDHEHVQLMGSEGGVRRTKHTEIYPPALCQALAQCAVEECS